MDESGSQLIRARRPTEAQVTSSASGQLRKETSIADPVPVFCTKAERRHSALVRFTHWSTTICFFALLLSGIEIVISHPRFYWGETGTVLTAPLFQLPIPSSRATVPTGYDYKLPDQNGWSRALHFQAAWIAVFTGLLYVISGLLTKHFRNNLLPRNAELSRHVLGACFRRHLRLEKPGKTEALSYNVLQRLTYLFVIFILFPLAIWSGLAMSLAFASTFPWSVTLLGGHQSARTIHFFVSLALVLFLFVHIAMICLAGFWNRTGMMITGRFATQEEQS